jgi:ABC-type glycerol-3-phosphate transport system substrate-binding protein
LTFWWWGEDEAPGLGSWLERVAVSFEAERDTPVRLRPLRHDEVLPGFPAAVAAGRAPDLHFFWNGIYLVDHVWRGQVAPLEGLLDQTELREIGGGPQSTWRGKTYRVGWYVIPVLWVANLDALHSAGIGRLPETWDELLEACAHLQAAGLRPITAGDGEGDVSVWWLAHFVTQVLDEPGDAVRLVLGELDWQDPRFASPWQLLADVQRLGYFDAEALPLTLWAGLARFNEGRSGFTLASGPMLAECRRSLGDAAAVMVAPRAGGGRLAGLPIVDTQGIGISAGSPCRELAAAFLAHLHRPDHRDALWREVGQFPADRRWPGPGTDADPDYARMWNWYSLGPAAPYVPNLIPLELHYKLAAAIGQAVLRGSLEPAGAATEAARLSREWVEAGAERAETYREWALRASAPPGDEPPAAGP